MKGYSDCSVTMSSSSLLGLSWMSLSLWVFGSLGLWVFGSLGLWVFGSLGLCHTIFDSQVEREQHNSSYSFENGQDNKTHLNDKLFDFECYIKARIIQGLFSVKIRLRATVNHGSKLL
jgi:hypothetical protein